MKLYMFRTVPLSIIRSFSLYKQQWYMSYRFADSLRAGSGWNCSSILILLTSCQQNCMTYTIALCNVKNSWWWAEELSETCRVSFQNKLEKLVHLVGFIIRKLYWNVCVFRFVTGRQKIPNSVDWLKMEMLETLFYLEVSSFEDFI